MAGGKCRRPFFVSRGFSELKIKYCYCCAVKLQAKSAATRRRQQEDFKKLRAREVRQRFMIHAVEV